MANESTFAIGELLPAIGGRLLHGNPDIRFGNYCIDSRYVDHRTLFVPLMGQSRDGHQFIIDSIGKGAVACFVRTGHHQIHEILSWLRSQVQRGFLEFEDVCVIEVRHTLVSLQKMAEWFRRQFDTKVIGITGSVGKTGTKEMLIQLLSKRFQTVGTEKNFNNEIGVPLALSRINAYTEMTVVEMAMRARGEISLLSRISHPNIALITNTSGSHVGRLGSFEEVYKAKGEIVDGLVPGGTVVLNRRDENLFGILNEISSRKASRDEYELMFFDASEAYRNCGIPPFITRNDNFELPLDLPEADVWLEDVELLGIDGSRFMLCTREGKVQVQLQMLGRGAIENLTAAAAAGLSMGLTLEDIAEAAPELLPAPQRLNLFQLGQDLFLIDDCYNSSPASVRDSLELLLNIDDSFEKILVIGDMLELGKYETLLHRQCALTTLNLPLKQVYAIGPRMNAFNEVEGMDDVELFYIEGRSELEASMGFRPEDRSFGAPMHGERSNREFGAPMRGGRGAQQNNDTRQRGDTVILDDRAASKLSALLLSAINRNDKPKVVMVKGSRALHLERVVNDLLNGTAV
ncbi:MAG: UDP-N-acetylmuramoyl-tripeptide--D-alanyl-D-alanine ligase [bacterium]